jgi:hypothetical protein
MRLNVLTALYTVGSLSALGALGCGGGDDEKNPARCKDTATAAHALTQAPARLMLDTAMLTRLQQRVSAADPAWQELSKLCDELASGTVHPPNGAAYPGASNVGQGYQGEGYLPAITSLALCYRSINGIDATASARYAAAGIRVLEAMSTPVSAGGQSPSTNSGYGIRNYGVGMALGYDWLSPVLSAATRARVNAALNAWIDWYDQSGFLRDDPVGNYFVGYFQAKVFAALATQGDNPKASGYWQDVVSRLWGELVKPRYSAYLDGGGWPEGWGYGPRAVRSLAEVLWGVKTAAGLDWYEELPQLRQQAQYLNYFAWPSLERMDDHGTVRAGNPIRPSATLATALATILGQLGDAYAPTARAFAVDVLASADDRHPWEKFFYWDPASAKQSYTSLALSYQARGPEHVAMRSSWDSGAAWAAFHGGAYINAPRSGEQGFNSGSLSVVNGGSPVLVNASGWIPHTAHTDGENFVYQDNWGGGGRRLYNTFYVDDASNPYNPGQNAIDPTQSDVQLSRYLDAGSFVFARAEHLEDQYGQPGGARPVTEFTRDVVFLRPSSFVVFDRTVVAQAGADQWLAFHTPTTPVTAQAADPSQLRYDVTSGGATVGSLSTLLPSSAQASLVALPGGTTRIELHAPVRQAAQQWLNVVTASSTIGQHRRLSPEDGNVLGGDAVGVQLSGDPGRIVLFSAHHAGEQNLGEVAYVLASQVATDHLIVDLAPGGYSVDIQPSNAGYVVRVRPGGTMQTSEAGTLHFETTTSGSVVVPKSDGVAGGSLPEPSDPTDPADLEDPSSSTTPTDPAHPNEISEPCR